MKSHILGQSYVARSVNAADNIMINLFPEATPDAGKENGFLNRAPGMRKLATIGKGPIRALWAHQTNGEDAYVVSGNEVFKIDIFEIYMNKSDFSFVRRKIQIQMDSF